MIFKPGAICVQFFSGLIAIAALGGAGGASAASVTHHYTVTVDHSLSRLSIEARFEKPVYSVAARSREAGKFLLGKRTGYLVSKFAFFKKEKGGDTLYPVLGCSRLVAAGVKFGNDNPAIEFSCHGIYCGTQ